VNQANRPDMTPLVKASETVGKVLKAGDIVIYESTVYPGATEEVCVPVLEKFSGLKFNQDFFCGYSPERINPGDKEHRLPTIKKVTSGSTPEVADAVDQLYQEIITAGTYKASSIKVAEAAKVIENTQRDVNIALINELALIFNKLGIDTEEVLKELPELIEVIEYCTWEGVDKQKYIDAVAAGNFMAMRRAAFSPQPDMQPSKLERLVELVEESIDSGQKVIVFSYFRSVIEQVMQALGERAIGPITGSVSSSQRQNIVDQFQSSPSPLALVGQIQAAGTGLNIQAASVVILCEPQIKPSLEVQAIARSHRMGQVRKVQVHRLILPESVDEQMLAMLARKQTEFDDYARDSDLANSAIGAKEVSEESIAKVIVMDERRRLGIASANQEVIVKDEEE
jgi:SNF2 family DNA or RNA helicase